MGLAQSQEPFKSVSPGQRWWCQRFKCEEHWLLRNSPFEDGGGCTVKNVDGLQGLNTDLSCQMAKMWRPQPYNWQEMNSANNMMNLENSSPAPSDENSTQWTSFFLKKNLHFYSDMCKNKTKNFSDRKDTLFLIQWDRCLKVGPLSIPAGSFPLLGKTSS